MENIGFQVISSPGFKDSIAKVSENNFDYAVVDMRLEDGSGLELVKELQKISISNQLGSDFWILLFVCLLNLPIKLYLGKNQSLDLL